MGQKKYRICVIVAHVTIIIMAGWYWNYQLIVCDHFTLKSHVRYNNSDYITFPRLVLLCVLCFQWQPFRFLFYCRQYGRCCLKKDELNSLLGDLQTVQIFFLGTVRICMYLLFKLQSTLVISNSNGLSEILRDIRTSTYQICRIEEKIIRLTTFNKYICNWTLEVRDILKILWKTGEIAP